MWKPSKNVFHLLLAIIYLAAGIRPNEAAANANKQKVCIIGAGASGLTSAKHLAEHLDEFDIVVFERNADVGGVWIYSDLTDVDEHNLPVHSSMYKYLRTNLPKELMAFPDYQNFSDPEDRSCVTHETVLSYLRNYTDHFNLRPYIQFNTHIEEVKPILKDDDWHNTKYLIKKKNLDTNEVSEVTCDAVMVCNGHYYEPNVPKIPGIEFFPGKVIHSHIYRKPEVFKDQIVTVLGASFSGIDISIEIAGHAKTVYLSHNKAKIEGLPGNVVQVAGVVGARGSELTLKDNSTIKADAFVFCTGYNNTYPFLDDASGIKVDDNHVVPLYKQLVNIEHPSMSFVGLPALVLHFPINYCQVKYFIALLQGKVQLPSRPEMMLDTVVPEGKRKRYAHVMGAAQWNYTEQLARAAGFEPLAPWYRDATNQWLAARALDPWHYKENNLRVSDDGVVTITKPQ